MDEERPIDINQFTRALRRALPAIAALAALAAIVTIVISVLGPKSYEASVTILALDAARSGSADVVTIQRRLETAKRLAGTAAVVRAAAARLPGVTPSDLRATVSMTADPIANVLTVTATAPTPGGAAIRANVAAETLVAAQRQLDQEIASEARGRALAEIRRLRAAGADATEIAAAQAQLDAVTTDAAVAAPPLRILERAEPPAAASSPRPLVGGAVAFLAVCLLGMLFVLAREQVSPRLSSSQELDQLLGTPVVENVPLLGRREAFRFGAWSLQVRDAFYALAETLRSDAEGRGKPRIVLVTSAARREGRTSVSAGLARALSGLGATTLVVSGDLRRPTVHELLEVPGSPGLSELALALHDADKVRELPDLRSKRASAGAEGLRLAIHASAVGSSGKLDVLPSGSPPEDPAQVLLNEGLPAVFREISRRQYDFVIVDSPPALGLPDVAALARCCDDILVVARVDRLTTKDAVRLRERLASLDARKLGVVVIGRDPHPVAYGSSSGEQRRPGDSGVIELG